MSTLKENSTDSDILKYFNDIIKNKEVIRDMFLTNIELYEKKIIENQNIIHDLKQELEFTRREQLEDINKARLEVSKLEDEKKKHDLNFKMLSKTLEHYEILVRERIKEINSLKQKSIFVNQDICNRKLQINSLTAQIEESEYQNNNLKEAIALKVEELNLSRNKEAQIEKDLNSKASKSQSNDISIASGSRQSTLKGSKRSVNERLFGDEDLNKRVKESEADMSGMEEPNLRNSNLKMTSNFIEDGHYLRKAGSSTFQIESSDHESKKKCQIF